jgi:hypothetical protein
VASSQWRVASRETVTCWSGYQPRKESIWEGEPIGEPILSQPADLPISRLADKFWLGRSLALPFFSLVPRPVPIAPLKVGAQVLHH